MPTLRRLINYSFDFSGGTPVAEYSYDPWGRARNPETLVIYYTGSEPELLLGRGYTGHEYLPWFRLYNMNARLYDPLVGRFLAPDPFVQVPNFTQNYNRYTYCLNNPLKYTDENGEIFTWRISSSGLSIGVNFSPFLVPLGFGINIGWTDGGSIGFYREIGFRSGGSGFGSGAYVSQSLDYSFRRKSFSLKYSINLYASYSFVNVSASASYTYDFSTKQSSFSWNVGIGVGVGSDTWGVGISVGYGSAGFGFSVGGNWDPWRYSTNPDYNPDDINNDPTKKLTTNCYDYVLNEEDYNLDHGHNPGMYTDSYYLDYYDVYSNPTDPNYAENVLNAAIADGRVKQPTFWNRLGFGKYSHYEVYLVTSNSDYHWYRRDSNGYWSHKPGITPVTNLDASGARIRNIFKANHGKYKNGGYLLWIKE